MNCQQYKHTIEAFIEGTVTDEQKRELETHIQNCQACRREYELHLKMKTVLTECFAMSEPSDEKIQSVLTNISSQDFVTKSAPVFSSGWFTKIAAGILLIAAIGLGFVAGRFSSAGSSIHAVRTAYQIQSLEGTVLVRHPGSDIWQPMTKETAIYIGDEFLSMPKGKVIFAVDAKSTITLNQNSMLVLKTTGDNTELYLANGSLDATLESPHGPFFVTTPHGRAEALGTEFTINVE